MIYRKCKIYKKSDAQMRTVAKVDVEAESAMSSSGGFTGGGMEESAFYTVTTVTEFNYVSGNYNILIPDMGDFKITGWVKLRENVGSWKRRFRYRLTLEN